MFSMPLYSVQSSLFILTSITLSPSTMNPVSSIQGQLLEVTVVGCNKLKDTEWISKQDPYVCLEYANTKFRTKTCTDGHKNPTFQEKFIFTLIEGLRELNVAVWNSNTLTYDDFIGGGRIQLQKVLSEGFDDTAWPLQSRSGRNAGEVRLILHYANASSLSSKGFIPTAPAYTAAAVPHVPSYITSPSSAIPYHATPYVNPPPAVSFPPTATYPAPSPFPSYPPLSANPTVYPPSIYHPPQPTTYAPQIYPPLQPTTHYPPAPYPGTYPPLH